MKTITLLPLLALCACSSIHYKTDKTDFSASYPFWSNAMVKGLVVDGTTKTTSSGLRISSTSIEPNVESITATSDALGNLIGVAAAAAAKGAK